MAKCAHCGKATTFGNNRPWSKKSTRRTFKPNLQKVSVLEQGKLVKKTLCARCIRTSVKSPV
ncbi:MAG: 50S ribosomal protein L28 [Anaerolineae bacterium]|nr:MAG: 50S ribosomal protein L28 [Anaerolineae bacterium]